ncbi:MAG: hypothetical protein ACT4PE_12075 [Candidatus Eiseniibacteriota bacterium]
MKAPMMAGFSTLLGMLAADPAASAPLGTAFTYQGRLDQNGAPLDGTAHLRFRLWDAASGGAQVGVSQLVPSVLLADGLFTVALNGAGEFGPNAWNGDARWLEVEVCTDPACGSSAVLSPRQPVTAAPYARHAAGPWTITGTTLSYSSGNVGIGTTAPTTTLSLGSSNANSKLLVWDGGPGTGLGFGVGPAQFRIHLDLPTNRFSFLNAPSGSEIFTITGAGNVGAGTSTPAAKLDVRGTVKHGPSGQYFVPGTEENLRILRGTVDALGNILEGSGFSATRTNVGIYLITFHSSFTDLPASTATASTPSSGSRICHIAAGSTAGQTYVSIKDGSGNYVDSGFHFWIIGPRF